MRTREQQLEFLRHQFETSKMYAFYWHAMATTGAAKLRNTAQGREPTEEEKAQGIKLPMRPHTDEEKTQDALRMMLTHIHRMNEIAESIDDLLSGK